MIRKLYNFSRNRIASEKKMKKFYPAITSFYTYLNPNIEEPKLIENLIVISTQGKFFWRTPQKYEVDIVIEKGDELIPVEVKYKNTILDKELKNIIRFSKKYGCKYGMVVTKDFKGERQYELGDNMQVQI